MEVENRIIKHRQAETLQLTLNKTIKTVYFVRRTTRLRNAKIGIKIDVTRRGFRSNHDHITVNRINELCVIPVQRLLDQCNRKEAWVGETCSLSSRRFGVDNSPGPAGSSPVILSMENEAITSLHYKQQCANLPNLCRLFDIWYTYRPIIPQECAPKLWPTQWKDLALKPLSKSLFRIRL